MINRAGYYRQNLSGKLAYKSFVPAPLPLTVPIQADGEMIKLLIEAHSSIAAVNAVAQYIPDMRIFVAMHVRKEALMSSQIEGTQATLEDIFNPINVNREAADVVNYVKATEYALSRLNTLPLCNRLLRETHAVLMQGVRGQHSNPGEFRRSQNWIGAGGCTITTARYVPPTPDDMNEAMSNLELYMNSEDGEALIQAALVHYQFETVHPFLDGNGRLGRLLIVLFLITHGVIGTPALCVSYYLKKRRTEYYQYLARVRESGDYEQWVKFFLAALCECAKSALNAIRQLTALHERNRAIVDGMGRSRENVNRVLRYLEAVPIIGVRQTAQRLNLASSTVSRVISRLKEVGILRQTSRGVYAYSDYLALLTEGAEPLT